MDSLIRNILNESLLVKERFFDQHTQLIEHAVNIIVGSLKSGHKILLFGNGGSAADCQHIAAEFVNRFRMERSPLPAIALTTDTSVITSIGNDYSFDHIFSKQILALGQKNDIAIGISTSGDSPNVIRAVQAAQEKEMTVIGFSGSRGQLKAISDIAFCVDSVTTARIQEVHILLAHILCELIERKLFDE